MNAETLIERLYAEKPRTRGRGHDAEAIHRTCTVGAAIVALHRNRYTPFWLVRSAVAKRVSIPGLSRDAIESVVRRSIVSLVELGFLRRVEQTGPDAPEQGVKGRAHLYVFGSAAHADLGLAIPDLACSPSDALVSLADHARKGREDSPQANSDQTVLDCGQLSDRGCNSPTNCSHKESRTITPLTEVIVAGIRRPTANYSRFGETASPEKLNRSQRNSGQLSEDQLHGRNSKRGRKSADSDAMPLIETRVADEVIDGVRVVRRTLAGVPLTGTMEGMLRLRALREAAAPPSPPPALMRTPEGIPNLFSAEAILKRTGLSMPPLGETADSCRARVAREDAEREAAIEAEIARRRRVSIQSEAESRIVLADTLEGWRAMRDQARERRRLQNGSVAAMREMAQNHIRAKPKIENPHDPEAILPNMAPYMSANNKLFE